MPCWPPLSDRQRQEAALNWPISFARMARRIAATIRCRFRISKSCRPWNAAAQRPWAATSSGATPVALSDPPITPAVTAPPQADQSLAKLKWLDKQKSELLPVGYFHLVFTLPHELNGLMLSNIKILLGHLFRAVGETLVDFGSTRLGGQSGFITLLHTWDQTRLDHFHLHCLVPAGALSFDQKRWTPARKNFLFPVTALSVVFCGKFLDLLKSTFAQNKLLFVGQTAFLANPAAFQLLFNALRKKPWIVYAKKPFGSPVHVLDYLGRYTHRVA